MKRSWIALFLLLAAPLALAQGVGDTPGFFHIPQSDVSRYILGFIFDNVGDVLYSPVQSTIFKGVVADFNNAALVLGAIIIIYSLVVSTVNTANDGEALGKKWNNAWIPLRSAGGFALMLPLKASGGYAIIQVFIMWVILQGVGAADTIWTHALKGIQSGQTTSPTMARGEYYQLASDVFRSAACAEQLSYYYNNIKHTGETKYSVNIYGQGADSGHDHIHFGVNHVEDDDCGRITNDDSKNDQLKTTRNEALGALVDNLIPVASSYVTQYNNNPVMQQSDLDKYQAEIVNAAQQMGNTLNSFYREQAKIVDAHGDASGTIFDDSKSSKDMGQLDKMLNSAQNFGWMLAGGYYLSVSNLSSQYASVTYWAPEYDGTNTQNLQHDMGSDGYNYYMAPLLSQVGTFVSNSIAQLTGSDVSIGLNNVSIDHNAKAALKPWFKRFPTIEKSFQDYIDSTVNEWTSGNFSKNPIQAVTSLGASMVQQAQTIWFALMGATTAIAAGAYLSVSVQSAGPALSAGLAWIMPFVMGTLAASIVNGAILQTYIPLIPYLLFTFGAIGWLILAIEAMVAGPLLALGILHPEGQHEVWGRAETGVMILASAFLRPSLMVAGFFASIPLSYGVIGFVNIGFGLAMDAAGGIKIYGPAGAMIFISLYTMILVIVFNKIFSLIHILPDKIMRWIQGPEERDYSGAQELQQMQGSIKEGAQQAESKMGEGLQQSSSAAREKIAQDKKKQDDGDSADFQ